MSDSRIEILEKLTPIFKDVFDNDALILSESSDSKSIANWDSLANVKLLVTVERNLKLRFRTSDITGLGDVGELISLIQRVQQEV
jgi:acyl carrier protein